MPAGASGRGDAVYSLERLDQKISRRAADMVPATEIMAETSVTNWSPLIADMIEETNPPTAPTTLRACYELD
jgi:hypothetical protein